MSNNTDPGDVMVGCFIVLVFLCLCTAAVAMTWKFVMWVYA